MNTRSTLLHKELQYHQIDDNTLQYRHGYGIMLADNGKETQDGDLYARNGRILYTRAAGRDPHDCRGLSDAPLTDQETARLQSGWFLESQQNRVSRVHGKEEKYPSRRPGPEINKASFCWQWTINKFTAVWLSLMRSGQLAKDNPWMLLLIFILHSCAIKSKTVLSGSWARAK